jgi:HAE1 family hydrophobic/amphiphilic exporter-1
VLQAVLDDVRANLVAPALRELPPGYDVRLGGSADKFSVTLAELTGSFWLAILITYLLLVSLFRSWLQPLVILVTVPLAMTGGLLGISFAHRWFHAASYDLLAMLGFVILAGIVVNNAILVIHQSNNLRAEGVERRKALAEAARTRLRPIVMTVATTVCGMLPLAIGSGAGAELYQGLAAVILGGLVLSTGFTLFLVPALVSLGWDVQELFTRRRAG